MCSKYSSLADAKKTSIAPGKSSRKTITTTKKIHGLPITLRNKSSFQNKQVWDVLEHVLEDVRIHNRKQVAVTVRDTYDGRRFSGTCHDIVYDKHVTKTYQPRIYAHITPHEDNNFPHWVDRSPALIETVVHKDGKFIVETKKVSARGYLSSYMLDRMECLVHVLSHEIRHIWQGGHRRGRVWGARGRYSDRDADAFAIRKVRSWRRTVERSQSDQAYVTASSFLSHVLTKIAVAIKARRPNQN
jgi:hypothetical protein